MRPAWGVHNVQSTMKVNWKGVFPAIATQFRKDQSLDLAATAKHLDTKIKLVQYIKLSMAETGLGSEMVRAPRLPLVGAEREEILGVIRHAIATRPALPAAVR
jgi:dihydrodipicolinate synthase/N-acetylneuraminate lyase